MTTRTTRCDHCGAPLHFESGATSVVCVFCKAATEIATAPAPVAPPPPSLAAGFSVGESVLVEWNGSYWSARVLEIPQPGSYLIHYDGYSSRWDEVVGPHRIAKADARVRRAGNPSVAIAVVLVVVLVVGGVLAFLAAKPGGSAGGGGSPVTPAPTSHVSYPGEPLGVGRSIQVLWHDSYWNATVVYENPDGSVRIHYVGWADSWDETVERSRIRVP